MTRFKYNAIILLAGTALSFASCDDYLDKMPDDRAVLDSEKKITNLLVTAYPTGCSTILISELSSDNVDDNGTKYSTDPQFDQTYRFKDIAADRHDSPRAIWNGCYNAVAVANEALQAIDDLGNPASLRAQRAEALLCRAFAMYELSTVFCMAYDPTKAESYLGLTYPKRPEGGAEGQYERGTLAELYANINADIEEALPLVNDAIYLVPKYHFNVKAAYAFAARFNLFYHKYDKAIAYATKVLGSEPATMLRNQAQFKQLSGVEDMYNCYIKSSEACNLLLLPESSLAGRALAAGSYPRYTHNFTMLSYETYWAYSPWNMSSGQSGASLMWTARRCYGASPYLVYEPKLQETFEYTDKVNGTGYIHIVNQAFTADETLMVRAEAYALKGDLTNAVNDLNTWCSVNLEAKVGNFERPTYTVDNLHAFMSQMKYEPLHILDDSQRSIKKTLHPQGFTVAAGEQESIIQVLLYARRIVTMFTGLRFMDVKRYGIEFEHRIDKEDPVVFKAGDLRGAIQLSSDVIAAGMQPNPR